MITGINPFSTVQFAGRTKKADALAHLRQGVGADTQVVLSKDDRYAFTASLKNVAGLSTEDILQKLSEDLLKVSGVTATDLEYVLSLNHGGKDYKVRLAGAPRVIYNPKPRQ